MLLPNTLDVQEVTIRFREKSSNANSNMSAQQVKEFHMYASVDMLRCVKGQLCSPDVTGQNYISDIWPAFKDLVYTECLWRSHWNG